MHVLCSQPARERESERPTRITNGIQFHLFPDSRIRITAGAPPPPNETVIEGCLSEAAAQHAHRWENDPVQPEMVSLHQGRLSSVDWHWAAQEESAPLRRIMMTLDFEFVH